MRWWYAGGARAFSTSCPASCGLASRWSAVWCGRRHPYIGAVSLVHPYLYQKGATHFGEQGGVRTAPWKRRGKSWEHFPIENAIETTRMHCFYSTFSRGSESEPEPAGSARTELGPASGGDPWAYLLGIAGHPIPISGYPTVLLIGP